MAKSQLGLAWPHYTGLQRSQILANIAATKKLPAELELEIFNRIWLQPLTQRQLITVLRRVIKRVRTGNTL
jgi:hypothetical protein